MPMASSGLTLLTGEPSPADVERQKLRDKQIDKSRVMVFDIWLQAYRDGDIGLELMLREARKVLRRLDDQRLMERALGHMVDQALSCDPPKRGRGNKGRPRAFRRLLVGLVDLAVEREGLSKTRAGDNAFTRVSDILKDTMGMHVTPRQVEDAYYNPK